MRARSLFPYAGGKFYLMKDIKEIFDKEAKPVAIDVFGGSGKFLLNVEAKCKVYNDIDSRVVSLFRVAKEKPEELQAWFKFPLHSRELFDSFKAGSTSANEVEVAAQTLYLQYCSFAGKGGTFGYRMKPRGATIPVIENALERVMELHDEIRLWTIEHLDFRELIRRYDSPDTFFYLDPPYHGKKFYRHNLVEKDFGDLARMLPALRGRYLMNINRDEFVIDCFGEPTSAKRYMSFCDNARTAGKRGKRTELFYWN